MFESPLLLFVFMSEVPLQSKVHLNQPKWWRHNEITWLQAFDARTCDYMVKFQKNIKLIE